MAKALYCSECPKRLSGNQRYTCGDTCRSKRSRRLRRKDKDVNKQLNDKRWGGDAYEEIRDAIRDTQGEAAHEAVKEELRPIAREAITEDVMLAIQRMVSLTPAAVAVLEADLGSDDPQIRQRAYTLLLKYTVGHQALVRPEEEKAGQMVVNFNLPRPGDDIDSQGAAVELVDIEMRTCDVCNEEKSVTQFVAGSDRCKSCYDMQRDFAQQLLRGKEES